jgi:hypothetical protein
MKWILFIFPCLLLCGCITKKPLELTNFDTGEVLHGMGYRSGKIEVTMPDGELLVGKWTSIRNESARMGGGQGYAYAILKSTKPGSKLIMEFSAQFDALNGTGGFGEAKTNDGRKWKVTF